ncbi:hypothetical protein C8R47DRAFT_1062689 [Mycena vitilis]|nr:hypothetical protein C8R47DRAFT_1062689 [Mycena vitilis]
MIWPRDAHVLFSLPSFTVHLARISFRPACVAKKSILHRRCAFIRSLPPMKMELKAGGPALATASKSNGNLGSAQYGDISGSIFCDPVRIPDQDSTPGPGSLLQDPQALTNLRISATPPVQNIQLSRFDPHLRHESMGYGSPVRQCRKVWSPNTVEHTEIQNTEIRRGYGGILAPGWLIARNKAPAMEVFSSIQCDDEDQRNHLVGALTQLTKTIETLKRPMGVTDKKTAFWNAYMKVADEHDKEFEQRYSTDLDVALIFAGLFSAIQPQLKPDAPTIIVAVQGLLYTSLFTTLLAALLAVLGKQWVMHYQAAGSRGTIEERGLERQRKLDGLRKWKLDTVLQTFPLLLQLALMLFSSALSLYLWPINRSVAGIVVRLNLLGFGSYILLLLSAAMFPDSPYQTPLSSFLKQLASPLFRILQTAFTKARKYTTQCGTSLARSLDSRTWTLPSFMQETSRNLEQSLWEEHPHLYFSDTSAEVPAVTWLLETSTDPITVTIAAEMAVDLQWPLDLDTTSAGARLTEIFDSCFDVRREPAMGFDICKLRHGMAHRAINCGMALGSLMHMTQASGRDHMPRSSCWHKELEHEADLSPAVTKRLCGVFWTVNKLPYSLSWVFTACPDKWELYVFATSRSTFSTENLVRFLDQFKAEDTPSLDESTFANYLCGVIAFFGPVESRILAQVDKSRLKVPLMIHLFKALQWRTVSTTLIARILNTTARLITRSEHILYPERKTLMTEICQFCTNFQAEPQSLQNQIFVSAATLATVDDLGTFPRYMRRQLRQTEWIFPVLEFVQRQREGLNGQILQEWNGTETFVLQSLLQFSAYTESGCLPIEPTSSAIQIIMQALSEPGNTSLLAFLTLCRAPQWFRDRSLESILMKSSVWTQLGRVALDNPRFAPGYLQLGEKIASVPGWKPIIHADLSTWVMVFIKDQPQRRFREDDFISVIRAIWIAPSAALSKDDNVLNSENASWIFCIAALSEAWGTLKSSAALYEYLRLARCAVSTSLRTNYFHLRWESPQAPIPQNIRATFSAQLGKSLIRAAGNMKNVLPSEGKSVVSDTPATSTIDRIRELLTVLGCKISTEFEPSSGEAVIGGATKPYTNWEELQGLFQAELDGLQILLGVEHEMGSPR